MDVEEEWRSMIFGALLWGDFIGVSETGFSGVSGTDAEVIDVSSTFVLADWTFDCFSGTAVPFKLLCFE